MRSDVQQGVLSSVRSPLLERMLRREPIDDVLRDVCRAVEELASGTIAGVCVLDRCARAFVGAVFPSIAPAFVEGICGAKVVEKLGSCALAVYDGITVTSDDIRTDDRFHDGWRKLMLQHRAVSVRSDPVRGADGVPLGTFVIASPRPGPVQVRESVVALGVELAGLALSLRREQEDQALLIGELQHRTRNLFGAIGGLARATIRVHPEPGDFISAFERRLAALARAHALATDAREADLETVLREVLAPHAAPGRLAIAGPPVRLARGAASAFAMAANELATNAIKYGALSVPTGRVAVTWDIAGEEPAFSLEWREYGGPLTTAPKRNGYGRRVIEQSLAHAIDGKVDVRFEPAGLRCIVRAPLSDRLAAAGPPVPAPQPA